MEFYVDDIGCKSADQANYYINIVNSIWTQKPKTNKKTQSFTMNNTTSTIAHNTTKTQAIIPNHKQKGSIPKPPTNKN